MSAYRNAIANLRRVVTDTFRPEPDTRDVTLKVTFKDVPSNLSGEIHAQAVRRDLDAGGVPDVTVEVVE